MEVHLVYSGVEQTGVLGGLITHRSEEAEGKAAAEFKSSPRYYPPTYFLSFSNVLDWRS